MRPVVFAIATALASAVTLSAAPVWGQNARSFVSGHGTDSSACTLLAPCRTFAVAFAKTNVGGEIDVLDAAGYGALNITHAISIVNDGVGSASVLVPSTGLNSNTGIIISAGPNEAVSLRGLTIDGAGLGTTGIQFNSGLSLTIENCVVRHVTADGIDLLPNAGSNFVISNTLVADNGGGGGIFLFPSGSGTVAAVFNRIELNSNGFDGLLVSGANSTGTVKATVSESVATGNTAGFHVTSATSQALTTLMLFHSVAANNVTGLSASGTGAMLRADELMVTGNSNGWLATTGGVVQSYGNNSIDGNGSHETAPTLIVLK